MSASAKDFPEISTYYCGIPWAHKFLKLDIEKLENPKLLVHLEDILNWQVLGLEFVNIWRRGFSFQHFLHKPIEVYYFM